MKLNTTGHWPATINIPPILLSFLFTRHAFEPDKNLPSQITNDKKVFIL